MGQACKPNLALAVDLIAFMEVVVRKGLVVTKEKR